MCYVIYHSLSLCVVCSVCVHEGALEAVRVGESANSSEFWRTN